MSVFHSIPSCIKQFFGSWTGDNSGSTTLLFAFSLIPLLLAAGVAFDSSRGVSADNHLQLIADGAALQGVNRFRDPTATKNDVLTAIDQYMEAKLDDKELYNSTPPIKNISVNEKDYIISVELTSKLPTSIMAITSIDWIDIGAIAEAQAIEGPARICVLALDPTQVDAIYMHGAGAVNAPDCWFWANSYQQAQAMMFEGGFSTTAAGYCSVGAHSISNAAVSPAPTDDCPVVPDPFANWSPPYVPIACDFGIDNGNVVGTTINGSGTVTLTPGRYCGTTRINGADVELSPGQYFFTDGDVSIGGNANVTGDEVYLHFGQGVTQYDIKATAEFRISAMTDPDLERIVIYKDPTTPKGKSSIGGNSDVFIDGAIYLPNDDFHLSGNTAVRVERARTSIVALSVEFVGSTVFEITPDPEFKINNGIRLFSDVRLTK
ncbi:MAG: Tad domain-containing protein [Hyphomicrobiaceae bacterium]